MLSEKVWKEFVKRVLPKHADQVFMGEVSSGCELDTYEIEGNEGKLILRSNTMSGLTAALGDYLRNDAKVHFSWCGSRIELPELLPEPIPRSRVIEQKYRSYFNYCTFNYSTGWWGWERWEQELDFMALNGINLPLAMIGIESVWYETLQELDFSEEEIFTFFSGPAFLAWQWMANIEGFAGSLSKGWIEKRKMLGKRIIDRQLELGMTPIQQGFSGFVPRLLQKKMPNAHIQKKKDWCGIEGTAQLDPIDPAFGIIGRIFLEKQKKLFGAYGYYAADPFHEGEPPESGTEYLEKVGKTIRQLILDFDENGIWVMQSWSIRREIACALPEEKLLILDLAGEGHDKYQGFWGYPFVTGNLHNFGGRTALHGDLELLAQNSFSQIREEYPNVCGTGLFMEGINQNPVYYDLAFDMLTRCDQVKLSKWLDDYVIRRYGRREPSWQQAWKLLRHTAYAAGTNGVERSSIICARPAVNVKKSGPNDGLYVPYGNRRLLKALDFLLETPSNSEGYCYDVIDILRQTLSNYGQKLYAEVSEAIKNRDLDAFQEQSYQFLDLLEDMDALLSLRTEFTLENWLDEARRWGNTSDEADRIEYCARLLLTLWGPESEPHIFDYAWREWSGLIGGYYKKRWEIFFNYIGDCLKNDAEYIEDTLPQIYGREVFRANECYEIMAEFETNWLYMREKKSDRKLDFNSIVWHMVMKYHSKI